MTEVEDDPSELVRLVGKRLTLSTVLANVLGAVVVFGYLAVLPHVFARTPQLARERSIDSVIAFAFVGYMAFAGVAGSFIGNRLGRPLAEWGSRGGPPTPAECRAILRQPMWQASHALAWWAAAALLFGVLVTTRPNTSSSAPWITAGGIGLASLTVWLLSLLLVERAVRPATAVALATSGGRVAGSSLNIRPKFFLAWAIGAGVPLLGVAGTPLLARDAVVPLDEVLVVIGGVVGALLILSAAASVANPVTALRRAMGSVAEGDLDVAVTVDDASELGQLQVGFNQMVGGLRERRRIEDLFGRHVGTEVARRELERGIGLGGERRDVSVLFVDLIGSSALAQEHTAEEVVTLLNALFGVIVQAAAADGGWVNKFEGDGALIVVGAPEAHLDHAARALRIARRIRDETQRMAVEHPDLDIGIGVSTGTVVAGNVGAEQRYEYTVVGDPVNEAARLTDAAKLRAGRLLATEGVVIAGDGSEDGWLAAGALGLRGRRSATSIYELPACLP